MLPALSHALLSPVGTTTPGQRVPTANHLAPSRFPGETGGLAFSSRPASPSNPPLEMAVSGRLWWGNLIFELTRSTRPPVRVDVRRTADNGSLRRVRRCRVPGSPCETKGFDDRQHHMSVPRTFLGSRVGDTYSA
ncbi:hypothetical protein AArcMg_0102 [Natrarchaeobaculum sulfurireducens]|uniref:Uncharacterized protein n=1 Tax=Natrarchaeobaculum sulfurireducens TaxID=2044521 RepID=A0A346PKT9_9EURY|nr:hypothetical protein AArc1_0105 [Natrarchaeobaculum sulfurireducens]AXR80134.1 hypothetical protein AArcMg_0102 [Natrarchaeobaculum sulfurireducens]